MEKVSKLGKTYRLAKPFFIWFIMSIIFATVAWATQIPFAIWQWEVLFIYCTVFSISICLIEQIWREL